ncbi:unnamed protein product [Prunus armeniaca]
MAALNRFISQATYHCQPFFQVIKGKTKLIDWIPECERAFQELKEYMGKPPLLSKPEYSEDLLLYLSVSSTALSSVLIREVGKVLNPMYYVSRALQDAETRYPEIQKLSIALVISA